MSRDIFNDYLKDLLALSVSILPESAEDVLEKSISKKNLSLVKYIVAYLNGNLS